MGIGNRIKEARINSGFSREELAMKLNISPSAISNYENDISHPKEPVLYNLLEVLNVDANFLFQDALKKNEPRILYAFDGGAADAEQIDNEQIEMKQKLMKRIVEGNYTTEELKTIYTMIDALDK